MFLFYYANKVEVADGYCSDYPTPAFAPCHLEFVPYPLVKSLILFLAQGRLLSCLSGLDCSDLVFLVFLPTTYLAELAPAAVS